MGMSFNENEGSRPVSELMVRAVKLHPEMTVGEAKRILNAKNVSYGVISNEKGNPFAIITLNQLRVTGENELVHTLASNRSHSEPAEPYESLDTVVLSRADDLVSDPDLQGVVIQQQDDVIGILPRKKIDEHIESLRGFERTESFGIGDSSGAAGRLEGKPIGAAGLLEGKPIGAAVVYECPDCVCAPECSTCPERKSVSYYDPANPPKCSKGHPMKRV